jgi:acyl carrier protein
VSGKSYLTFDEFAEVLSTFFEVPRPYVQPDTVLSDDLGLDSIYMLEVLLLLEDVSNHPVPDEVIDQLGTVADVYHYYRLYNEQSAEADS